MAKYHQVVDWLSEQIVSQQILPGTKLESENELSQRFQVSRQTVRRALEVLQKRNLIESVKGSGSFVKIPEDMRREKQIKTVYIISTYVDSYIFPKIIRGMSEVLSKEDYNISLMFTQNRLEDERRCLEKILRENIPGALIAEPVKSGLPNPNLDLYQELKKRGYVMLFFHSSYPQLKVPCVEMNDFQAGKLAAEYLIQQGHRKIGGIFKFDDRQGPERYRGYVSALREAGIPIDERSVLWYDTVLQEDFLQDILKSYLKERAEELTALLCYNDEIAHLLTQIFKSMNRAVPEDMSLICIDNSELAILNSVPLTCVTHPMEKLGRKTAENLLKLMRNSAYDASYQFEAELVIRSSVKPCSDEGLMSR